MSLSHVYNFPPLVGGCGSRGRITEPVSFPEERRKTQALRNSVVCGGSHKYEPGSQLVCVSE